MVPDGSDDPPRLTPRRSYRWPPASWFNPEDPGLLRPPDGMEARPCTNCQVAAEILPQKNQFSDIADRLPGARDDLDAREISAIAYGARRSMGTLNQNCDALRMDNLVRGDYRQAGLKGCPPGNPDCAKEGKAYINTDRIQAGDELERHAPEEFFDHALVAKSSFYRQRGAPGPHCRDVTNEPAVFYVTCQPKISGSGGRVMVDVIVKAPRSGRMPKAPTDSIDFTCTNCSGFLSGALALAGQRIHQGRNDFNIGSSSLLNQSTRAGGCFDAAEFKGTRSIKSGDVLAIGNSGELYGHVMTVESVGPDPWGIGRVHRLEECRPENLPYEGFDFTIIQSGSILDRLPVSRMQANQMLLASEQRTKNIFGNMAVKACKAQLGGQAIVARTLARGTYGPADDAFMRHSDMAACRTAPAALAKDGACMDACPAAQKGRPQGGVQ